MIRRLTLIVALVVGLATPAGAGFDEGRAAYERGDFETALREFRPLAEQGLAEAQAFLGGMYANGLGVPRDDAEAAKWWRKAAEQGNAQAQLNLSSTYRSGQGVLLDYDEGRAAYERRG
ncbi:MAG: tetratricopeptide repeat protein [Planctomycetota bacterium]|jgi:TPR repeat protein